MASIIGSMAENDMYRDEFRGIRSDMDYNPTKKTRPSTKPRKGSTKKSKNKKRTSRKSKRTNR